MPQWRRLGRTGSFVWGLFAGGMTVGAAVLIGGLPVESFYIVEASLVTVAGLFPRHDVASATGRCVHALRTLLGFSLGWGVSSVGVALTSLFIACCGAQ